MGDRRISITEARDLQRTNHRVLLLWRPEEALPEDQQYAVVLYE